MVQGVVPMQFGAEFPVATVGLFHVHWSSSFNGQTGKCEDFPVYNTVPEG
jgi:hypothetical protein